MDNRFKIPLYKPEQLNSNITYGLTKPNNISQDELESVQWLCEAYNWQKKQIADLEAKLAESENKLNRYPYKNEVIEEQYEDLKDAITFLMLNNIKDQEQLNYSIDVLCEKHKARIRDIENSICSIEQLKQQLAEKDQAIEGLQEINQSLGQTCNNDAKEIGRLREQLAEKEKEIAKHKANTVSFTPKLVNNAELVIKIIQSDDDGIDYLNQSQNQTAIDELENVRKQLDCEDNYCYGDNNIVICINRTIFNDTIDQQISRLRGEKE